MSLKDMPTGELIIPKRKDEGYFNSSKTVIELTPKDFDNNRSDRLIKHRCSIVLFYAPWCPHCKKLIGVWNALGESAAFFNVCAFNCEKYKDHCEKIRKENPKLIQGYPSINIYNKGTPIKRYEGERNLNELIAECFKACNIKSK